MEYYGSRFWQFIERNKIDKVVFDSIGTDYRIRGYRELTRWWGTRLVLAFDARGMNQSTALSAILTPMPTNILEGYKEYIPLSH